MAGTGDMKEHDADVQQTRHDWCDVDDCPAAICNGPHVSHRCPNGDLVSKRFDNTEPCPFCGSEA